MMPRRIGTIYFALSSSTINLCVFFDVSRPRLLPRESSAVGSNTPSTPSGNFNIRWPLFRALSRAGAGAGVGARLPRRVVDVEPYPGSGSRCTDGVSDCPGRCQVPRTSASSAMTSSSPGCVCCTRIWRYRWFL